jgi:8-oxo-dGTP pyrophosphatase MutT (NUDIX family)
MKQVAKLVIIDEDNKYLLLYRNNHPEFGNDPDLPGGTLEEGDESSLETMLREVQEEAGISIDKSTVEAVYAGTSYSKNGTHYSLFVVRLHTRPEVILSWEHTSYAWLDRSNFLQQAASANDTYMHMVYDVLK